VQIGSVFALFMCIMLFRILLRVYFLVCHSSVYTFISSYAKERIVHHLLLCALCFNYIALYYMHVYI